MLVLKVVVMVRVTLRFDELLAVMILIKMRELVGWRRRRMLVVVLLLLLLVVMLVEHRRRGVVMLELVSVT